MKFVDGRLYQGQLVSGSFHGKGMHSWPSGIVYIGEFRENSTHGIGTLIYPDGFHMEGQWNRHKPRNSFL